MENTPQSEEVPLPRLTQALAQQLLRVPAFDSGFDALVEVPQEVGEVPDDLGPG